MNGLKFVAVNVFETLVRVFPLPCRSGLVKIGNPGRGSPVFLTCNYHLTVERVKRALKGMDCYLLVANSRGINVWCAATGGHFTNHDVISVLKTSGIEDLVDHRRVILPQLAASGIEAGVIQKRIGWKVIWGPVYAKDIP
ncbi:MAG: copper oxidase, partial [Candidatus Aminicenantales bacterium]